MDANQIQELCERVAMATLNGGQLQGFVFRHDDTPQKAKTDMVIVKAGGPMPQLDGPRGYRVEVEIEVRSAKAARNAVLHGEALRRITYAAFLRNGALSSGLTEDDDFYVLDEEITGDRQETKNLRKRTIIVPFIINPKSLLTTA